MTQGWTKLCGSLITSSIWMEDDQTRILWVTMLALADRFGRVMGSVPGLAHLARIDLEACQRGLEVLLAPDPHSRTKAEEGRRIRVIDGGWQLINHAAYKIARDPEVRREQVRQATARWRANKPVGDQLVIQSDPCDHSVIQCEPIQIQSTDVLESSTSRAPAREESPIEPPPGFPRTDREAVDIGAMVGVPAEWAETYWHQAVGRGYVDSKGVRIHKFPHALKAAYEISKAYGSERKSLADNKKGDLSIFEMTKVIEAKQAQAEDLRYKYSMEVATGTEWCDQAKREEWRVLRKEIKSLQAAIASRGGAK